MILSIISIVLAITAIVYCGHCAIVFQRFNDGINRSARNILRELDEKITEQENDELKNNKENE